MVNPHEKRWPAAAAFLTAGLLPATTARRTGHVPLGWAWALHVLAALAAALLAPFLQDFSTGDVAGHNLAYAVNAMGDAYARAPEVFAVSEAAACLSIELGFVVLALLVMPWGAQDEPIRVSMASALRRTWLQTPHVILAAILVTLLLAPATRANQKWWSSNPPPGNPAVSVLTPPAGHAGESLAWRDYEAALDEYNARIQAWSEEWERFRKRRPWHLRFLPVYGSFVFVASFTWVIWGLLRAVGTERPVMPIAHPPLCATCGYNLTALAAAARCPECGDPVALSLGPLARPGTEWQHLRGLDRISAWRWCAVDAIVAPGRLGRQVRVTSRVVDHRWFLAIHLGAIFGIGAGSAVLCFAIAESFRSDDGLVIALYIGQWMGWLAATLALGAALFAAAVVGIGYAIHDKRNLLNAAIQAACYLGGYLVLWFLVSGAIPVLIFALKKSFVDLARSLGIFEVTLGFVVWVLPNIACLIGYVWFVWRATSGARYANR